MKAKQIHNLMILLKRRRDQFQEIKKHQCQLVMDGSPAVVDSDVFDAYSPVINFSSLRSLIILAFGNAWEMRRWDISVAFTNALPEEPTYFRFPQKMPDEVISYLKGGDYALLRRNLYGSKTARKLRYKCLIECLTISGFNLVAGHSCLFVRKTVINGKQIIG